MTKEQLEAIRARESDIWLDTAPTCSVFRQDVRLLLAEIDRLGGINSAAIRLIEAIARGDGSDQTQNTQLILIRTAATVFMDKYGGTKPPIKAGSEAEK